jgi:hypothetical protein
VVELFILILNSREIAEPVSKHITTESIDKVVYSIMHYS